MSAMPEPQSKAPPEKTRWGCLSIPIAVTLLFAAARIQTTWRENQPLSYHLRNVFKESGFVVPDSVTDLNGTKSPVDFQGDFSASVTFTVRPDDIETFMHLPAIWRNPTDFKRLEKDEICGDFKVPAGSFMIGEWVSSEYNCKYAVNRPANRIYFYRCST
jgi:hypothetical protein